jgi:hypothetical protein
MPSPTGLLILKQRRRLLVTASAMGLVISKPESFGYTWSRCCSVTGTALRRSRRGGPADLALTRVVASPGVTHLRDILAR